jgi:CubicO group peptidase (beta-lactamase class C family)
MKRTTFSLLTLFLAITSFAQDSTAFKLDELVNGYASAGRFNGTVLVAKQGKILLQKGYGYKDVATGTKNDENSLYQIASITKPFTSTVVLKLVELKKLSLGDKLSKYYKGFPNGDSITIEHLLTHTSGLHNLTEYDTSISETDEKRQIAFMKSFKPDFAPGTSWHYSNSGYILLGYIIQKVSGMSYWQAVRNYIFKPANMTASGFDFINLKSPHKATGYETLNDSIQQQAVITDSTVPFAAGAIYSSVKDMYKWYLALQQYRFVKKELMDNAYKPCSKHSYGYGWQIDSVFGKKWLSHSGSISGFGSNFARIDGDDICIIVLSNKAGSTFDVMNITRRLQAVLYKQPYVIPVKRIPVRLPEDSLKKYTGKYEIAEMNLSIDMFLYEGMFVAQPYRDGHPGPTSIMLALDATHFYDKRDQETEINFDVNDSGKVVGVTLVLGGNPHYAKRKN